MSAHVEAKGIEHRARSCRSGFTVWRTLDDGPALRLPRENLDADAGVDGEGDGDVGGGGVVDGVVDGGVTRDSGRNGVPKMRRNLGGWRGVTKEHILSDL